MKFHVGGSDPPVVIQREDTLERVQNLQHTVNMLCIFCIRQCFVHVLYLSIFCINVPHQALSTAVPIFYLQLMYMHTHACFDLPLHLTPLC